MREICLSGSMSGVWKRGIEYYRATSRLYRKRSNGEQRFLTRAHVNFDSMIGLHLKAMAVIQAMVRLISFRSAESSATR